MMDKPIHTFKEWLERMPKAGDGKGDSRMDILRDWGRREDELEAWIAELETEKDCNRIIIDRATKTIDRLTKQNKILDDGLHLVFQWANDNTVPLVPLIKYIKRVSKQARQAAKEVEGE